MDELKNNLPEYGINVNNLRKAYLRTPPHSELRKNNYHSAREIYDGFNSIEDIANNIGIPHNTLEKMNSSEILGLYGGIGRVINVGSLNSLEKLNLSIILSTLVRKGYESNGIRNYANYKAKKGSKERGLGFIGFSTKPDDLIKRMETIDPKTEEIIRYIIFDKEKKVSRNEDSVNGYFVPNLEDIADFTGTGLILKEIADGFFAKYCNNIGESAKGENNFVIPEKKIVVPKTTVEPVKRELSDEYIKYSKKIRASLGLPPKKY